jgi:hypothetical protein
MRQQIFKQKAQKICLAEFDPALILENISEINSKEPFGYNSLIYEYNVVAKNKCWVPCLSAGRNS